MRILISGSTGFLGTFLIETLKREGHTIGRLVRPETGRGKASGAPEQTIRWDPVAGEFDAAAAEGFDALVHLAGASIAGGRWSRSRKRLLRTSRIDATRHLIGFLSKLQRPPRVIVAASAIGYYGDRGDETLTETSAPGGDFLATLCREWEAETARGAEFGARVVTLRFGIILAAHRGSAAAYGFAVQAGRGRKARLRPAMDVLADSGRGRRHNRVCAWQLRPRGPGKCRDSQSGAKHGIYTRPGEDVTPPGSISRAGICAAPGAGRNGRRVIALKPASHAVETRTERVQVCEARSGESAR